MDALQNIASSKKLAHIPMILETPRMKSIDEAKIDVERLRSWINP